MTETTLGHGQIVKVELAGKSKYLLTFEDGHSRAVPRVTTVLGALAKPALIHWAANEERQFCIDRAFMVYAEAMAPSVRGAISPAEFSEKLIAALGDKKAHQMKSRKGMDIGAHIHEMIQLALKKQEDTAERPEAAMVGFMAWEDWAKSVDFQPTHVETKIGSDRLGVGGTVDAAGWATIREKLTDDERLYPELRLIEEREGRVFLVPDWKSNKPSKYRPNGIYDESLIQASVYCQILIEMGEAPEDAWAGVVRLPKDENDPCIQEGKSIDYQLLPPEERYRLAEGFEHIRAVWELMDGGVMP